MAKIKLTKNELKAQRDALKRFSRYLPTLQLKKQQLQMEAQRIRGEYLALEREAEQYTGQVDDWIQLLDQGSAARLGEILEVEELVTDTRNVAGVDVPVFEELRFRQQPFDLFLEPLWYDDVIKAARQIVEHRIRLQILDRQRQAIEDELLTTTQRVNLFEKVKIPEARENIRRIQIFLGDEQTAAVGRAKIAKRKTQELETV